MRAAHHVAVAALLLPLLAATFAGCSSGPPESQFADRLAEADQVFNGRQYAQAGVLFEDIAAEANAVGDNTAYTEAAAMRARTMLQLGDRHGGEVWLEQARVHSSAQGDPVGWSRYLGVRGRFEWTAKDSVAATATFKGLFDYCETNELYERAVDATHMIAIVAPHAERFEWAHKGIAMAEAGELTGWLGPLWNNLGWDYVDAGNYEKGLEALEQARVYHYETGQQLSELIADYSVAHVKRLMGDIAAAKTEMQGVFDQASGMQEAGHLDAVEWMGFSRWELAEIAIAEGDSQTAVALMRQALSEFEQAGMPRWDPDDWQKKQARLAEVSGG